MSSRFRRCKPVNRVPQNFSTGHVRVGLALPDQSGAVDKFPHREERDGEEGDGGEGEPDRAADGQASRAASRAARARALLRCCGLGRGRKRRGHSRSRAQCRALGGLGCAGGREEEHNHAEIAVARRHACVFFPNSWRNFTKNGRA